MLQRDEKDGGKNVKKGGKKLELSVFDKMEHLERLYKLDKTTNKRGEKNKGNTVLPKQELSQTGKALATIQTAPSKDILFNMIIKKSES